MGILGAGFNFNLKSGAGGGGYVSYLDNTYWEADPGALPNFEATWTGSAWLSDEYAAGGRYWCYLQDIGGWASGFRPSKIRLSFTGGDLAVIALKDTTGAAIASDTTYFQVSPVELDITFGANDIHDLEIDTGTGGRTQFSVTGIEFLE